MIVNNLKKSILDYALRGYLTKNNLAEKINVTKKSEINNFPYTIPSNWSWFKVKDICTLIRGNGIKRNDVVDCGVQCIRYGEIYTTYSYSFNNTVSFVPKNIAESCKKVAKNDLLLTLTGENEYDIAKATTYLGEDELVAGGDLAILTSHYQNPMFLSYYFASPFCIKQKSASAKGNIIVHTSIDKIGEYLIPIPPVEEQNRIVDKINLLFSKLNEMEPIEQELIKIKQEIPEKIKKSLLREEMHLIEPSEDNWDDVNLKELVSIVTGKKDANYGNENGKYLFFTCSKEPIKCNNYSFEGESILLAGNGNIGNINYYDGKFEAYQRTYVLQKKSEKIDMKFLYYQLLSNWVEYNNYQTFGTAIPYIKLGNVQNYIVRLPKIEIQKEIVSKIEQILPLCNDIERLVNN